MKRIVEAEMETSAVRLSTALNRFFKKYPELDYWREQLEYMAENGYDFCCDDHFASGRENPDWCYALHLDVNELVFDNKKSFYICIIERK